MIVKWQLIELGLLLAVFITVTGCGPNTYGIARMSSRELTVVSDADICYAQRHWRSPQMINEISRRNLDCSTGATRQSSPTQAQITRENKVQAQVQENTEAEQKNLKMIDGDEFIGTWQYQETYTDKPQNYLKILKVGPGRFRLIEGFKDGYETSFKDKDTILWRDQKLKDYADDVIYLRLSSGKLEGEFVSGVFRATHGQEFTYKITLDLKSNNTLLYSVWSSISRDTETREATRISSSTRMSLNSSEGAETLIIGNINNTRAIGDCSCSFRSANAYSNKSNVQEIFFGSSYDGRAWININGQDVDLHPKGIKVMSVEYDRKYAMLPAYTGKDVTVYTDFRQTGSCPPESSECEVASYDITVTVEKGGLRETVKGKGSCGC